MTYSNLPIKVLQFGEGNFLRAFADYIIDNDGPLQETLDQILRIREGNS